MNKKEIMELIDCEIGNEVFKSKRMGTEPVTVYIPLTDEDFDIFLSINKYKNNDHYWWERDEDGTLIVSWVEDAEEEDE